MPRLMRLATALIFSISSHSALQASETFDICKSVYISGSRDISSFETDSEKTRTFVSAVCTIDASSRQDFDDKAAHFNSNADMVYGLFGLKIDANTDYKEFYRQFKAACTNVADNVYIRQISRQYSSIINKSLGEAFNECIKTIAVAQYAQNNNFDVYQTFEFQGTSGKKFSVYLTFSPKWNNQDLVLEGVSPADMVSCKYKGHAVGNDSIKLSSKVLNPEYIIDCDRTENENIKFNIEAEGGLKTNGLTIPRYNDPINELRSQINEYSSQLQNLQTAIDSNSGAVDSKIRNLLNGMHIELETTPEFDASQDEKSAAYSANGSCPSDKFVFGYWCEVTHGDAAIQNVGTRTGHDFICTFRDVKNSFKGHAVGLCGKLTESK